MSIQVCSHIYMFGDIHDRRFNADDVSTDEFSLINANDRKVLSYDFVEILNEYIDNAIKNNESVGGIIECCILGMSENFIRNNINKIEGQLSGKILDLDNVIGIDFERADELYKSNTDVINPLCPFIFDVHIAPTDAGQSALITLPETLEKLTLETVSMLN